jgi:SNF2 family DNA or RNA helicase
MKYHIDLLSDSSSSSSSSSDDDFEGVSKDKNLDELNLCLTNLNLDDTRVSKPKQNRTKNQSTKRRLIKKKDHLKRLQSYRNTDGSSESGSSRSSSRSRSSIQSDSESDDDSIMTTECDDRQGIVSKVASTNPNDVFVDLVDTSDDDDGEKDKNCESNKHDWISLDASSSTSSDSDDDFKDKRVRKNHYEKDSSSTKKGLDRYEQTNAIALSDDDDDDDEKEDSISTSESTKLSSSWIKTQWKGSCYYTLPKAAPSDDSNGKQIITHPDIYIPSSLFKKMYDHQKVGVEWISSLHVNGIGGILGDDMGLGKTLQTLSLLGGLMTSKSIRNALVVCPKSLLLNWEREARDVLIRHCKLRVCIIVVDSNISQDRRERIMKQALKW